MPTSRRSLEFPITRASHFVTAVRCLKSLGVSTGRDLARCNLPSDDVPASMMLPVVPILRFCGEISRREGIGDLGLRVGRQLSGTALPDPLRWKLATAPTLNAALRKLIWISRIMSSHVEVWTERQAGQLWVRMRGSTAPDVLGADLTEHYRITLILGLLRVYLGPGYVPRAVDLETATKPPPEFLEFLGGCACRLGRSTGGVPVPLRLLATPLPDQTTPQDPPLPSFEGPLQPVEFQGWIDLLELFLPAYLGDGSLSENLVAEILRVSPRTLQRRLRASGRTFREVVERVRFDQARRLLAQPDLPIREISERLGYGNPSNFTRAFWRIAGRRPSEFRAEAALGWAPRS